MSTRVSLANVVRNDGRQLLLLRNLEPEAGNPLRRVTQARVCLSALPVAVDALVRFAFHTRGRTHTKKNTQDVQALRKTSRR